MEKINFVCKPKIMLYSESDRFVGTPIDLTEFLKSYLWNRELIYYVSSSPHYPATVLEIVLTKYTHIYMARIRYWDGVGVYEVELTYDNNDKLIESKRDYLTL